MKSWKTVWRKGFAPQITTEALRALQRALECDDERLIQGATTTPPPLQCMQDCPVEAACLIGYCGWQGEGLVSVAQVEKYFSRQCFNTDQTLREPHSCRFLLNWFDETPRDEMRQLLLTEVKRTLSKRQ